MNALQRRILLELEFGRKIECADDTTFKWLDKKTKPPLDKKIIKMMLRNGCVTKTVDNRLEVTGAGRGMLRADVGLTY